MSLKKITIDSLTSDKGSINFKNEFSVQIKTNDDGTLYFTQNELYEMFNAKDEEEGKKMLCEDLLDSIRDYYDVPASKLRSSMSKDINVALKKYIKDYEIK